MKYDLITTDSALVDFCAAHHDAPVLGFDTEFVSEDTYRPDLCLVQVACGKNYAIIDPEKIASLDPFWKWVVTPNHVTIVHAGREEIRFCLASTGQLPANLFDTQIAAALIGLEYPAAYSNLLAKLLDVSASKAETRTDWRRRPLTPAQLDYALVDVIHLAQLREIIFEKLSRLSRLPWLAEEMADWQNEVVAFEKGERWRRVPGISSLGARGLAILQAVWQWREDEALARNQPARRVLRDDLLVELAKRQTADPKRIAAVRGMEFRHLQKHLPEIASIIDAALRLSEKDCPRHLRGNSYQQLNLLGQFISTVMGGLCREAQVAPSLAATSQDVRELLAHLLGIRSKGEDAPRLSQGWRAQVLGNVVEELIRGKISVRVANPTSEEPLVLDRRTSDADRNDAAK